MVLPVQKRQRKVGLSLDYCSRYYYLSLTLGSMHACMYLLFYFLIKTEPIIFQTSAMVLEFVRYIITLCAGATTHYLPNLLPL